MKNRQMSLVAIVVFLTSVAVAAPKGIASEPDRLRTLLRSFLSASHTASAHERFWADDLVYTSSSGLRFGKAEILEGFETVDGSDVVDEEEPSVTYSGEDIDVRVYGDTAIVAFRLVGTPLKGSTNTDVVYYFNTATFLKRDLAWRVVAWQATKIPSQ